MSELEVELSQAALVDSVRDQLLVLLKDMPGKFTEIGEKKQRYFLEQTAELAKALCRTCCDIIAADGRVVMDCRVGKVGVNEGTIEAKISVDREGPLAHAFVDAAHGPAVLAFVNYEKFTEEQKRPAATPDQKKMFSEDPKPVGEVVDKVLKNVSRAAGKVTLVPDPDPAAIADHMKAEDSYLKDTKKKPAEDSLPPAAKKKTAARRTTVRSTTKASNGKDVDVVTKKAARKTAASSMDLAGD